MKKKKEKKIKTNKKIAVHAFFLTLFSVFFAHWLSDVLGIEALASKGAWGWIALFVWYFIFVIVGLKIADRFF